MSKKKKPEVYKPKTVANKKQFSNRGVIFEVERDSAIGDLMIKMAHWPHCGMDERTSLSFGKWLIKRSKDIKDDRARQLKMARHKIKGALNLKEGDCVECCVDGKNWQGVVFTRTLSRQFLGVPVVFVKWTSGHMNQTMPTQFFADGRLSHKQTKPFLRRTVI